MPRPLTVVDPLEQSLIACARTMGQTPCVGLFLSEIIDLLAQVDLLWSRSFMHQASNDFSAPHMNLLPGARGLCSALLARNWEMRRSTPT
jgi:hypothetical protein